MSDVPTRLGAALALAVLLTLLAASPLAAAGGAGHSDTVLGMPRWLVLSFNLVVFFGIIGYFAGPALVKFLEDKGREMARDRKRAAEQLAEAEQMEQRIDEKIAELRREIDELGERAEREGERERQQILAEAERELARLSEQTRYEIDHRLEQARQELTAHAVELASRLAEQRISGAITGEDRRRIFEENLVRLEKR